ncbi:D-lactate dehydrogenase (cytochrome) [Methylobacterium sp. 174MFSha1.1]|uniref:FAD-binding oxidoreductase n=1 Tax=Methylobacterium sp. 174MFSha1.1 TaxID=1502749 RepID=UPI0008E00374|nr:FAD-linked oxidase C-terminal domain-containing protein [Methylobacterium sp. 174MFSha1.1]SFU75003.1 D-lactate dehydrogenase (cytochrome) [Methylobacterium sp. 174MFSha1.1]
MEGSIAARPLRAGLPDALIETLSGLLGERFSLGLAEREHHGRGESYHATQPPDAVCYALSTREVSEIVRACAGHRVPVIPFGGGTSLEGHVAALQGGVCLDLSRMTGILAVRPEDLDATVEAGVTRHQLNAHLRDTGLFFPVDPGGESTLGGMAATRASGTNAVRYGTMKDNVVSLTAVMADGTVIRTGTRARKSSAGYDLTRLLVGSEGTLGIITEVTVRLHGIPEAVAASVCAFPSVEAAVATVVEIVQCGVPIARVELLDPVTIAAVNRHSGTALPEAPTLFMEFHGTAAGTAEQMALVGALAEGNGALGVETAADAESRARLWKARHDVHYAIQSLRPNGRVWSTDVCVPIASLPRCLAETRADIAGASFPITTVGHVGDGNFHLGLIVDPTSEAELAEAAALNDRLVRRAIAMDGTCTGEHGIGSGKIKFMDLEHGAAVGVMAAIKRALDPLGILNPGKVLPAQDGSGAR